MTSTAILIPARYHSTRIEGKPLCMLNDKTMIQSVVEACKQTQYDVHVLTDHKLIAQAAKASGAEVYIDSEPYENGTERCAGAIRSKKFDTYDRFINVQGDMPDVTIDIVSAIIDLLDRGSDVATVYTEMAPELASDPNTVKMIKGTSNAQWFGRGFKYGHWHLGVYGYTKQALQYYPALKVTEEEQIEKLEQLRWIKNGWQISVNRVQYNGIEINSPEDVELWHSKNSQ